MKYPQELVHRFGAKAGVLMHVAKHLLEIPQMPMVVKTPDQTIEDALKRAEELRIRWPRLYRSSAVAELWGYEGEFPTYTLIDPMKPIGADPRSYLSQIGWKGREIIRMSHEHAALLAVQHSPKYLKRPGRMHDVPDEISVIIVQKSPSKNTGILIKHPNRELYLIALEATSMPVPKPPTSFFTYNEKEGFNEPRLLSREGITLDKSLKSELEQVVAWHDKISGLPEMDPGWAYQLEFGATPLRLYQVRPFKPRVQADFTLDSFMGEHFVIGITPKEGIQAIVETPESIGAAKHGKPIALSTWLRRAHYGNDHNVAANIITSAEGLYAHNDVRALRQAQVSVICHRDEIKGAIGDFLRAGDLVTIRSDGTHADIARIEAVTV